MYGYRAFGEVSAHSLCVLFFRSRSPLHHQQQLITNSYNESNAVLNSLWANGWSPPLFCSLCSRIEFDFNDYLNVHNEDFLWLSHFLSCSHTHSLSRQMSHLNVSLVFGCCMFPLARAWAFARTLESIFNDRPVLCAWVFITIIIISFASGSYGLPNGSIKIEAPNPWHYYGNFDFILIFIQVFHHIRMRMTK